MTSRRRAQLTRHVHLFAIVYGTATIDGRRYHRYQACVRRGCKARRKP
jgi:hypothetical protein